MNTFADFVLTPISMFSGKPLAVSIALGLLFTSFALFFFWLYPAGRRFVGAFNAATAQIHKIRLSTNSAQEERLARVDAIFENSVLAPNWTQYRACVDFNDGNVFNYSDPEHFFAAERVPGNSYLKWSTTLGGVYLTLGLVFTFIGLSAALLQMSDTKEMQKAIERILDVSSAKFITSIAGIIAYIFWTVVARLQANAREHATQELCREIRLLSTFVAPESILRRQLHAVERQEQQFQSFGNDLAVAIGQQIETALLTRMQELPAAVGESVAKAIAPVQTELNAIGTQIGKAGGEIVGGAGDVFSQVWEKGVGAHLGKFGDQMDKAIFALGNLPEKIHATEAGFGGEIDRTTRRLSETTEGLTESLEQTQKSIAAVMEQFTARIASIPKVVEDASRNSTMAVADAVKQALVESSAAAADASTRSAGELAMQVATISGSLAESSLMLKEAGDHSADALKAARVELGAGVKDGVGIITQTAKDATAELAQTIASLASVVDALTAKLSVTAATIEGQTQRLVVAGDAVGVASHKLSLAAGSVEAATSPLSRSASSIDGGIARLTEATLQLKSVSESSKEVSTLLNSSIQTAKAVSAEQERQFNDLQKALRQTLEEMIDQVRLLGAELSKCMDTYDSEITKSISSLEAAILDVGDILDNRPSTGN